MLDLKFKLRPGHTSEREWMKPAPPESVFWNSTYACNFHCGICFTDGGQAGEDELTTEEALKMVENLHASGIQDIKVSGGEPFRREDLTTILIHMAELGLTARIASNGSLLNPKILKKLRNETLTKSFQISLDTLNPNLYRKIHGTSAETLKSVLESLRNLLALGFHTTVSVRLTRQTLPEIPRILNRAHEEGWATVTVHLPLNTKRYQGALPQQTDYLSLLRPVFEHFSKLPAHWLVETYIPWVQYHPEIQRCEETIRFVHRGCYAGRGHLTITPSGFITPCVCLDVKAAFIGDVRKDSLIEILKTSPLCRMMQHPDQHGICVDCPYVRTCGGGCRAAAFAITGRLDGQDESCPLWQKKNRLRDKNERVK